MIQPLFKIADYQPNTFSLKNISKIFDKTFGGNKNYIYFCSPNFGYTIWNLANRLAIFDLFIIETKKE